MMKSEPSRREVVTAGSLGLLGAGAVGSGILGLGAPSRSAAAVSGAYQNNAYTLPPLPYGYDALEPLYDERTLTIHHTKHHAGYVNGLNATLAKLEAARASGDYSAIKALSRDLAFNGSGHVLHTLFWHSMSPDKPDVPESLRQAMTRSFGSVDAAQKQFAAATKAAEASGWGVLAYEPIADTLLILQAEKHQNLAFTDTVALLVCDVWEHAYYLKYANDRGAWVDNFMKMANWPFAAQRLEAARKAVAKA
ncbi:MAG TPA: superoxide dismutase [Sedimentisphaerales bacterium]|nr:superoxide dismutase [Sedimentisphaerales bacterium]HRS11326.1 superoxide dismutase [Sedimentisphaerales bacterium]HRV47898.1 superoxide dismutase [Sedimentisphaerales bacterium]